MKIRIEDITADAKNLAFAEPEQEIGLWCRIAERFTEFSKSEGLNLAQRHDCFAIMLHCSTVPPEQILEVVTLKALTREQAQRAVPRDSFLSELQRSRC